MSFQNILNSLNNGSLVHEQSTEMTVGNKTILTAILSPESVPPQITKASIGATGNILSISFSEAVRGHDGFVVNASGGVVNLTYDNGEESNKLYFLTDRVIAGSETVTLDYVGPAVTDIAGNELPDSTGEPVQ